MIQETEPKNRVDDEPTKAKDESFIGKFMELPRWEQYTAAAAVIGLLAWLGASGWASMFAFGFPGGWFFTLTLIGCVSVIALSIAGAVSSRSESRRKMLMGFAVLPALGGAIELLQHFWTFVAFVAATAMAFAAYKLWREPADD